MDLINITDQDNNIIKMEVVSTFKVKDLKWNYIIYRDLEKEHYYLAKYMENKEDLITDLTDEEIKLCNSIFNKVIKNGIRD